MKHRFIKTVSALFLVMTLLFSSTISAFADSTDKWVPNAPMSTARAEFQTAVVNGELYVLGGLQKSGYTSSVEKYDPATDKWTPRASMLENRAYFQTAVINNKIYAIGGMNLSSMEEYDPETNKWTPKKSMHMQRRDFQVVVINNKIYAMGGVDSNTTEEYDPATDTWTMKAPMLDQFARHQFKATQLNGVIYAIGGSTYPGFERKIEAYDIQKDKWSEKASLPIDAFGAEVQLVNNKIYIIGGCHYSSSTSYGGPAGDLIYNPDVEVYDPSTNICSPIAPMKKAKDTRCSVIANGNIYVYQEYGYWEEFHPQTNTWEMKANSPDENTQSKSSILLNNTIYFFGSSCEGFQFMYSYSSSSNNVPSLTVAASPNKVKVGQQFTTDIAIHNETNICAEDIKLTYDKDLFEYEGAAGQTGTKIYKEDASTPGTIRFIIACQGKDNAATGDKGLITLKFKAKAKGVGKVDIVKGRIADNATLEEDVADENCGEDTITVDGYQDVNRSGNFTLLDLGIDAYYDGMNASDTDSTKYDADVIPDGKIDDNDLTQITQEILANKDYAPNN